ncbi:MAG: hypothetical protein U9M90_00700 [Patescibacteria group bacterium]|nr:hypothetical protein [Patescibacteria group bacterium]
MSEFREEFREILMGSRFWNMVPAGEKEREREAMLDFACQELRAVQEVAKWTETQSKAFGA